MAVSKRVSVTSINNSLIESTPYMSEWNISGVLHPDTPYLLASTVLSGVDSKLGDTDVFTSSYQYFSTKSSTARGRSKSKDSQPVVSKIVGDRETVALEDSEDVYERPNGDKYYSRKWGDHGDVAVIRKAREHSQFVLLYGPPGTGKTAMVEAAFGDDLYTVLGSGDTEVSDLVGGYVQSSGTTFRWDDGPLLKAAEEGKVLLIDEIGLIDPKVLSIVYGLMDGRREYTVTANPERGTVKAKDGFYVVAATNPNAPGVRLSEALLSRFVVQVEVTTDWALAKKLGVDRLAVTAAQNLSKRLESGDVSWAPQLRELLAFRDLSDTFGVRFALQNLLAVAPEMDRPVVSDVFSRAFGEQLLPARI